MNESKSQKTRVLCYGLGPIGRAAARLALGASSIEVVGAVDVDPELIGRDLGLDLDDARLCLHLGGWVGGVGGWVSE